MQLAGPLVDFAVDKLAQPEVFLAVAQAEGYSPDKPIPDAMLLARLVKTVDAERACVTAKPGGPCLLVFRNEAGVWKLIASRATPSFCACANRATAHWSRSWPGSGRRRA